MLLLPALALVMLNLLWIQLPERPPLVLLFLAIELPFYAVFVITCHRVILAGPESVAFSRIHHWTMRETQFVGMLLLLVAVWLSVAAIVGIAYSLSIGQLPGEPNWGLQTPLAAIVCVFFWSRLGLVLPARSIDRLLSMSDSWHATAGYGLRISAAILAPMALFWILSNVSHFLLRTIDGWLVYVVMTVLDIVLLAVEVAVVSVAYRGLVLRRYLAAA